MPELPEVETVRKGLQNRLNGFCISNLEVCRDSVIASPGGSNAFKKNLIGKYPFNWDRRGKYLIASLYIEPLDSINKEDIKISSQGFLGVHLRMTGHFQWHSEASEPCPHTRVRFWDKNYNELRFVDVRSFGQMWWVPPNHNLESIITGLKKLGPEPFSKDFNPDYLKQALKDKKKSIKAALLDQSIVAGSGNIYSDESLFCSGISPERASKDLNHREIKNLYNSLVEVLNISIGEGGTTFSDFRNLEGLNGNYGGQAWVYGRGGKPCKKCGETILKKKISGRSAHWCPTCQV